MSQKTMRWTLVASALLGLLAAHQRTRSAPVMARSANAFLASLNEEQRAKAVIPFDSEERFNFHFIPRDRKGLPLKEMTPTQRHLAQALLNAGLSQQGLIKANQIMSLEDILRIMEKDSGVRRNPEGYFFSVFGTPAADGNWGYRVEGHHLSLNYTVVKEKVSGSPNFFGTNPAEVREGPRKGLRVLAAEEDLGRALLLSLTAEQKSTAVVDKTAYKDILTAADRRAALKGQPNGLAASKMTAKQRELLQAVIDEYAYNLPEDLAEARLEKVRKAGTNLFFAWAGVEEKGGPHYYRVQGPTFLIEYDNTQNGANHVHSVWRDLDNGDFGEDLLKKHYATAPAGHGHSHRAGQGAHSH